MKLSDQVRENFKRESILIISTITERALRNKMADLIIDVSCSLFLDKVHNL